MEISSSSGSCFDLALDFLAGLNKEELSVDLLYVLFLRRDLRVLQTFDLYLSKCRRRNHETCSAEQDDDMKEEQPDVISFRIRFLIQTFLQHLKLSQGSTHDIIKFRKFIFFYFKTGIEEYSCINLLSVDHYWLRDPSLVIDFLDSVSENLTELFHEFHFEILERKLRFLKNLIRFAMLFEVEPQQLTDLSINAEVVAVNVLHLLSVRWFYKKVAKVCEETDLQLSRLMCERIDASDPQVRETYISVLTASKVSRLSDTSLLEKNRHQVVVDFIDCLVHYISRLLESPNPNVLLSVLKLLEGLRFLTVLLKRQEVLSKLCHEMNNLIRVVVCDAAILSISMYQYVEEDLAEVTDLALLRLLVELEYVRAEVSHVYPLAISVGCGFPRTNELGSLDFLLKNLEELAKCVNGSISVPVDNIQTIQRDLKFLRSSLKEIQEQRNQNQKLQAFWSRVMEVAYRAELVIDLRLVGDWGEHCLDDVAKDINLMKNDARKICDSISRDGETSRATKTFPHMPSQIHATITYNEDVVGLDRDVDALTRRLTRGSKKLVVVPIVGMPGLGKTTLANKVYNAPSVVSHFHMRAWGTLSQVYNMHKLLDEILCCIGSGNHEQHSKMDEGDLAAKLKQALLRNKYLLVLDDLWDTQAWHLLAISLPDDTNGSRILITSRIQNLFHEQNSYHLRQLTNDESWELLQKKLFGKQNCPANLSGVGYQIAKSCKGLPLTVILVAGILATAEKNYKIWEEVAENLSSSILLDDERSMMTIELSYNHLPDDLKQCLLYFGSFQEDQNINVRWLLWRWIAEGFVQQPTEGKSLEDVADENFNALVQRSLIMVSKQRTLGGAKGCRLHDLVHEFCVRKGKEENFLHNIHSWKDPCILTYPSNPHRVCDRNGRKLRIGEIMQFFPSLRSLLLFNVDDLGFWLPKLLRVLDFRSLEFYNFPVEVVLLVHLRYLALYLDDKIKSIPYAIANLSRLQTFLVKGVSNYLLPESIWNIKTLRHLSITGWDCGFVFPAEDLEASTCLDHLHTVCLAIDPSSHRLQKILTKLPNIRRLKCVFNITSQASSAVLGFDDLSKLESLSVARLRGCEFLFPSNLKKLTLSHNQQPWSEISAIGKLPNLEVLKLLGSSFDGDEWEVKEGEFPNLRFLKLYRLDLCRWSASSDNFPSLEKLVLHHCEKLRVVPASCLGECPMLEMIEVSSCRESVASSVKKIQQEQIEWGNVNMNIVIANCMPGYSSEEEEEEEEE